jgi:hypothetical protein
MTASERKPSYFNSKTHSGWSKGAGLRESGIGWNAIGKAYFTLGRKVGEGYLVEFVRYVRSGRTGPRKVRPRSTQQYPVLQRSVVLRKLV